MEKQVVKRITAESGGTEVTFNTPGGRYLVKNYSNGDVYVSLGTPLSSDESIKIASGMGQLCVINEKGGANGQTKTQTLYITGNGEVEVQQLWY